MLEIVDAERHRLRIGDRAQVPSDLEVPPVRLVDRRFELGSADIHVRLEAVHPLVRPEGDLPPRVLGRGNWVVLDEKGAGSFEIRPCDVQVWPDQLPGVDFAL